MINMKPHSEVVHRSLLQRDLMGGIPQIGLLIIFILCVVFIYGFRLYFSAIPIFVAYLVMRGLTKRDNWLIDFFIEAIKQKDVYIP